MAARGEAQADVEVSTLVVPAWRLRWRAPELALVLGERAVALASTRRDEIDRLRAEALVIFASNRMGRGVKTADRALDALKAAEAAGERETAWRLRVELADSARSVGAPLTGFAAVRPVLEADDVPPGLRASALVQAGECLVSVGRGPALAQALDEADGLYQADPLLDHDTTILHRGLLRAAAAGQHRRWGDLQAAIAASREGLALLDGLREAESDNGQVRGRLTVELVCALLDSNAEGEASRVGTPLLERPVRAPSAATAGWLRLALATRVHLPAGRVDRARDLLHDVADSAERHQLDTLRTESLLALAHVHEVSGDLTEALADLRAAHAAERRRARAVYAVRARLAAEFSGIHRQPAGSLHEQLATLLRTGTGTGAGAGKAAPTPPPAPDANLAPEVRQQLRQWRPVQVHRNEGLRVKRSRRAAEDMTVDGISAARAHAADRWRLVHPFGEQGEQGDQDEQGHQNDQGNQGEQGNRGERVGRADDTSKPTGRRRAPDPAPNSALSPNPAPVLPPNPTLASNPAPNPTPALNPTPEPQQPQQPLPSPQPSPSQQPPSVTKGRPEHARSVEAKPTALSQPLTPPGGSNLTTGTAPGPTAPDPGPTASSPDQVTPTADPASPTSGPVAPTSGPAAPTPPPTSTGEHGHTTPGGPTFPSDLALPDFALPNLALPNLALPNLALPSLTPPDFARPDVASPNPAPHPSDTPPHTAPSGQEAASQPAATASSSSEPPDLGLPSVRGEAGSTDDGDATAEAAQAEAAQTAKPGGERTVPAAGLIAAAGAVRSGRRRAAREAAEGVEERSSEQPVEQAGESPSVLDSLKAAGLLDPQRAGGRRRAPERGEGVTGTPVAAEQADQPEATTRPEDLDPRAAEPRAAEPRAAEPRAAEPRAAEPRA
ncbi:hypothetical protein ACFV4N_36030, partial [Actinosynnema sp. NPDC059797]